jgi:hypothetical protein
MVRRLPRGVGLLVAMAASAALWKLIFVAVETSASRPPGGPVSRR